MRPRRRIVNPFRPLRPNLERGGKGAHWMMAFLAMAALEVGCSRKVDLPEARAQLDRFLEQPDPGSKFDAFLRDWERHARFEDLQGELLTRRSQAGTPSEEAELFLVDALASLVRGNPDWTRAAFVKLAEHPAFGQLLTEAIEGGQSDFVEELVDRIGAAFAGSGTGDPKDEDPFGFRQPGYTVLSAIADTPAAVWPLRQTLIERDWVPDSLSDRLLGKVTGRAFTHDPDRMMGFLRHSPILAESAADFDPISLEIGTHSTLLEELVYQMRRGLPDSVWNRLIVSMESEVPGSLGAELIAAHRLAPGEIPIAAAGTFERRLDEILKLDPNRQAVLAALASRMSAGHIPGEAPSDPSNSVAFREWLAAHGETPRDAALAGPWLEAARWENLPGDGSSRDVQKRVAELLSPLRLADPAVARDVVIHVSRLDRERTDPAAYANRQSTVGEEILDDHLFEDRTGVGRAFILNTFVAGKDELGVRFWSKFDEWQSFDLSRAMGSGGKNPEEKFAAFLAELNALASGLDFEDKRILIGSAIQFANGFPRHGIKPEDYLSRIEAELTKGIPDKPDLIPVLKVYRDGARLALRRGDKAPPDSADPAEMPYRLALEDETQCWTWRFAVGSQMLFQLDGRLSDEFTGRAVELLLDGYRDGRRFTSDLEGAVVRSIDLTPDETLREQRRERYLAAWKQRFLAGEPSTHLYHVMGRTLQMILRQEDYDTAERLLDSFPNLKGHPAAFVSAIIGGDDRLALELQQDQLERFNYHPRTLDPGDGFDRRAAEYLDHLATESAKGTLSHPADALALHARAMFLSLDGAFETPGWESESKEVASAIGAAYRESSAPPLAVNRALYLMAGLAKPPRELAEPLRDWFADYDCVSFFANGLRYTDVEFRPIQLHVRWVLEDRDHEALARIVSALQSVAALKTVRASRDYRDPFLDETLVAAIKAFSTEVSESEGPLDSSENWIGLFRALATLPRTSWEDRRRSREVEAYFAAAVLADRGEDLIDWQKAMPADQRDFLDFLGSEKRNAIKEAAILAMRAKWVRSSPELRRRIAEDLLAAAGTRPELDFVDAWQRVRLANADELLAWSVDLATASPREGHAGFALARLAREKGENDLALRLIALAEEDADSERPEFALFQLEHARILTALGKKEDSVGLLKTVIAGGRLSPESAGEAAALLAEWED